MFLGKFVYFVTLNVLPSSTKVPWSSLFCETPEWYCDNVTVKPEVVEHCTDDCAKYRYCENNEWCVYDININEAINTNKIDLVIIDIAKFLPRCTIKNLPKLKTIFGKNKDIAFVEPWAFWNLPELNEINLSFNYIKGIEYGSFSKLSSVRYLDLSWNEIEYIGRGSFQGMTNLEKLDLSRNYINRFDATYYFSLANSVASLALKELNLSHNKLTLVVNLNTFQYINIIDLSYNELDFLNLTSILRPSQWLKKLDLTDNSLYKFDMNLPDVYIEKLRIPFNKFYDPIEINIASGNINFMVLDGNPWQCEVYNQLLKKFSTVILNYDEDEDVYFVDKFERGNYPFCFVRDDSAPVPASQSIFLLEASYKKKKNPSCSTNDQCPNDMFCKSGRCWKGCEQNVCVETAVCIGNYHGFFCQCPIGKFRNPFVSEIRCYNVDCFEDVDCQRLGHVCNKKKHKCEYVLK